MKRIFDLVVSLILIIVLSIPMIIVMVIIRINMGSPVMFKQKRPGLNGVPVHIYKFRTMSDERDEKGNLLSDDVRLTKTGEIIRRFSLDELPQLFNVFRGDISLVGPRPLLMEYLALYTPEQARRHNVKPGITGWAQINGRNAISWEERFKLDVYYVENKTFWLDMRILLLTVLKVFKSEGVNQEGHVTMEKFEGSTEKKVSGND